MQTVQKYFEFVYPLWLLALLLLPAIALFDYRKRNLVKFPISSIIVFDPVRSKTLRSYFEWLPSLLKFIACILIVFALARPREVNQVTQIQNQGYDIILILDASDSMHAVDMELDGNEAERMDVVKAVVKDFVRQRPADRIGMVVFGEEAFTQCPLTMDHGILEEYLGLIEVGMAGPSTAIGNGIATALKRLEQSTAKSKIIILLSDGKSNSGEVTPMAAAEYARQKGIRIHTIAIGTGDEAPVYVNTLFGRRKVMQKLEMDEEALKMIAEKTGGEAFLARTTDTLKSVYEKIDQMEKSEIVSQNYQEYDELFPVLAFWAGALLVLHALLRHTLFMRLP